MSEEKNKPMEELVWNQTEALGLCHDIEQVCPKFGCHVALTGGLLYKGGQRKDCDILFYRIRQQQEIDVSGLWGALVQIGFEGNKPNWAWCSKVKYKGKPVDLFFPDYDGEYGEESNIKPAIDIAEAIGAAVQAGAGAFGFRPATHNEALRSIMQREAQHQAIERAGNNVGGLGTLYEPPF